MSLLAQIEELEREIAAEGQQPSRLSKGRKQPPVPFDPGDETGDLSDDPERSDSPVQSTQKQPIPRSKQSSEPIEVSSRFPEKYPQRSINPANSEEAQLQAKAAYEQGRFAANARANAEAWEKRAAAAQLREDATGVRNEREQAYLNDNDLSPLSGTVDRILKHPAGLGEWISGVQPTPEEKKAKQAQQTETLNQRKLQRLYAQQSDPEMVKKTREILEVFRTPGRTSQEALRAFRALSPKEKQEVLLLAPGVAQQMGDDRGSIFGRAVNTFWDGAKGIALDPLTEIGVDAGGAAPLFDEIGASITPAHVTAALDESRITPYEMEVARQLQSFVKQETGTRSSDPWYERGSLGAVNQLPYSFPVTKFTQLGSKIVPVIAKRFLGKKTAEVVGGTIGSIAAAGPSSYIQEVNALKEMGMEDGPALRRLSVLSGAFTGAIERMNLSPFPTTKITLNQGLSRAIRQRLIETAKNLPAEAGEEGLDALKSAGIQAAVSWADANIEDRPVRDIIVAGVRGVEDSALTMAFLTGGPAALSVAANARNIQKGTSDFRELAMNMSPEEVQEREDRLAQLTGYKEASAKRVKELKGLLSKHKSQGLPKAVAAEAGIDIESVDEEGNVKPKTRTEIVKAIRGQIDVLEDTDVTDATDAEIEELQDLLNYRESLQKKGKIAPIQQPQVPEGGIDEVQQNDQQASSQANPFDGEAEAGEATEEVGVPAQEEIGSRQATEATSQTTPVAEEQAPDEIPVAPVIDEAYEEDALAQERAKRKKAKAGVAPEVPGTPEAQPSPSVGQFVQWTSNGADQFKEPKKVVGVETNDGVEYLQLEGESTWIPAREATVVKPKAGQLPEDQNEQLTKSPEWVDFGDDSYGLKFSEPGLGDAEATLRFDGDKSSVYVDMFGKSEDAPAGTGKKILTRITEKTKQYDPEYIEGHFTNKPALGSFGSTFGKGNIEFFSKQTGKAADIDFDTAMQNPDWYIARARLKPAETTPASNADVEYEKALRKTAAQETSDWKKRTRRAGGRQAKNEFSDLNAAVKSALKTINLKVSDDLSPKAIQRAFRKAAAKAHQDSGGSVEQMAALNEAVELLSSVPASLELAKRNWEKKKTGTQSAPVDDQQAKPRPAAEKATPEADAEPIPKTQEPAAARPATDEAAANPTEADFDAMADAAVAELKKKSPAKTKTEQEKPESPKREKRTGRKSDQTKADAAAKRAAAKKAMADVMKKLDGMASSGVNPVIMKEIVSAALLYVEADIKTFKGYVEAIIEDFGDAWAMKYAPYLEAAWRALNRSGDVKDPAGKFDEHATKTEALKPAAEKAEQLPKPKKNEDAAFFRRFGLKVSEANGQFYIQGDTREWKETIKDAAKGHGGARFFESYRGEPAWQLTKEGYESLQAVLRGLPIPDGATRGSIPNYVRDPQFRGLRASVDERPDNRRPTEALKGLVSDATQGLILAGEKFGIPKDILGEQIEDVGMILDAHDRGENMFLLANEPGSGKTFVLGAAIRELQAKGAKTITYVTLREELIDQIKKDLAGYGIENVNFVTYAGLRTRDKDTKKLKRKPGLSDVLIFDEAHSIKNLDSEQGAIAEDWIQLSEFSIFASATPFENPVQAKYLSATGVFDDLVPEDRKGSLHGFKTFATIFGAQVSETRDNVTVKWVRTATSDEDAKAAQSYLSKRGLLTTRRIRLPVDQVDSRMVKVNAPPEHATRYSHLAQAAISREDKLNGHAKAWVVNLQKRMLEDAKLQLAIQEADAALDRGRFPIIFVETKEKRSHDIPTLVEQERLYQQVIAGLQRGEPKPKRSTFGLPPAGVVEVLDAYMQLSGQKTLEIAAPIATVRKHFGKRLAVFTGASTGEVTQGSAHKDLAAWRAGTKPVLMATMAKGGTGLSLHDTKGDHPTTQIGVNMPWTATQLVQVAQRSARYGLAGKAEIIWLFADNIPFDRMLAGRVGGRMADMGATVHGQEVSSAANLLDWNFEDELFSEEMAEKEAPKKAATEAQESDKPLTSSEQADKAADILSDMESNQAKMREDKKLREGEKLANWLKAFEGSPREVTAAKDLYRKDFEKAQQNGVPDDRLIEIIDHGAANGMFSAQEASDLKGRVKPSVSDVDAVPIVTADQFGDGSDGTYDQMHAGLASKIVQQKIAIGMKGIDGREYGIFEHGKDKWQLVSRPIDAKKKQVPAKSPQDMSRKEIDEILRGDDLGARKPVLQALFPEWVNQPEPVRDGGDFAVSLWGEVNEPNRWGVGRVPFPMVAEAYRRMKGVDPITQLRQALNDATPDEYEALRAISDKNNRRPYSPDAITESRIKVLREAKLISGTKHFKLTGDGLRQLRSWEQARRDAEMKLADAEDRLQDSQSTGAEALLTRAAAYRKGESRDRGIASAAIRLEIAIKSERPAYTIQELMGELKSRLDQLESEAIAKSEPIVLSENMIAAGLEIKKTENGWSVKGLPEEIGYGLAKELGGRKYGKWFSFRRDPIEAIEEAARDIIAENLEIDAAEASGNVRTRIGTMPPKMADEYERAREERIKVYLEPILSRNEGIRELLGHYLKTGLKQRAQNTVRRGGDLDTIDGFNSLVEALRIENRYGLPNDPSDLLDLLTNEKWKTDVDAARREIAERVDSELLDEYDEIQKEWLAENDLSWGEYADVIQTIEEELDQERERLDRIHAESLSRPPDVVDPITTDLFGNEIKAPKAKVKGKEFESADLSQGTLFSTAGAPGQMNLFPDDGVPDDMVAKPSVDPDTLFQIGDEEDFVRIAVNYALDAEDAGITSYDDFMEFAANAIKDTRRAWLLGPYLQSIAKKVGFDGVRSFKDVFPQPTVTRDHVSTAFHAGWSKVFDDKEKYDAALEILNAIQFDKLPGGSAGFAPEGTPVPGQSLAQNQEQNGNVKGWTKFISATRAIIGATSKADFSTFIHELFHPMRKFLLDRSIPLDRRQGITDEDLLALEKYAGVQYEKGKDGKPDMSKPIWDTPAEEKAAKAWEQYWLDGWTDKLPAALKPLFEKIARWMRGIYQGVQLIAHNELTPQVRALFDKIVQRGYPDGFQMPPPFEGPGAPPVGSESHPEELQRIFPNRYDFTAMGKGVMNYLRELEGIPGLETFTKETVAEWVQQAEITLAADPYAAERLYREVAASDGRPLDQHDVTLLAFHYRKLANDAERAFQEQIEAAESGDPVRIAQARTAFIQTRMPMTEFEELTYASKSNWGRAGVAMQVMLRRDFTVAGLMKRAQSHNHGKPLSKAQKDEMDALAKQIEDLQKEVDRLRNKYEREEAETESKKQHDDVTKDAPPPRQRPATPTQKTTLGAAWDRLKAFAGIDTLFQQESPYEGIAQAYRDIGVSTYAELMRHVQERVGKDKAKELRNEFRTAWKNTSPDIDIAGVFDIGDSREMTRLARAIQRDLVEGLFRDRVEIIELVREEMSQQLERDITTLQAMDWLSGYGQFTIPSKEPIEAILRKLNTENLKHRQIIQLGDALARVEQLRAQGMTDQQIGDQLVAEGMLVRPTGPQRDKELAQDIDIRALQREYNDLKSQIPVSTENREGMLQTRMGSVQRALANRIADIKEVLANPERGPINKPRRVPLTSPEIEDLRKQLAEAVEDYRKAFPKEPMSEAQRVKNAIKAAERSIKAMDKQIKTRNFDKPKSMKVSSPELDALEAQKTAMRAQIEALKALELSQWEGGALADNSHKQEAAVRKNYIASVERRIAEYERIIAEKDFKKKVKIKRELTDEELKAQNRLREAKRKTLEAMAQYHLDNLTGIEKAWDYASEFMHLSRAVMTSLDMSALGNQGALTALSHPVRSAKVLKEIAAVLKSQMDTGKIFSKEKYTSIEDFLTGIDSQQAEFNYMEKLKSGKWGEMKIKAGLALLGSEQEITKQEEIFQGRWGKYVPGVAISSRVYTMMLNGLRSALFDAMAEGRFVKGNMTLDEAKLLASFVNITTGRSDLAGMPGVGQYLKRLETNSAILNTVFFAPRFVAARFQYLAMPLYLPFAGGGISKAWNIKRQIYTEMGRTLGSYMMVLFAISLLSGMFLDDDDEERPTIGLDPTTSDFGKVKIGDTRIDFGGGILQSIVFLSRLGLNRRGDQEFGEGFKPMTRAELIKDYIRTKMAPIPGYIWTAADDWKDPVGQVKDDILGYKVHPAIGTGVRLFIPLTLQNMAEVTYEHGAAGLPLAAMSFLGVRISTYGPKTKYAYSTPDERSGQLDKFIKKMTWDSPDPEFHEFLSTEEYEQVQARRANRKQSLVNDALDDPKPDSFQDPEDYTKAIAKRDAAIEAIRSAGWGSAEIRQLLLDHWKSNHGSARRLQGGMYVLKDQVRDRVRRINKLFGGLPGDQ